MSLFPSSDIEAIAASDDLHVSPPSARRAPPTARRPGSDRSSLTGVCSSAPGTARAAAGTEPRSPRAPDGSPPRARPTRSPSPPPRTSSPTGSTPPTTRSTPDRPTCRPWSGRARAAPAARSRSATEHPGRAAGRVGDRMSDPEGPTTQHRCAVGLSDVHARRPGPHRSRSCSPGGATAPPIG